MRWCSNSPIEPPAWGGATSCAERGPVDAILALALIHHLAISKSVPLPHLAAFFRQLGRWLIIKFVPKGDSQGQELLAIRDDIFPEYSREGFDNAFSAHYAILASVTLPETQRVLHLMEAVQSNGHPQGSCR